MIKNAMKFSVLNLLTTWEECDILHKRVRNTDNKAEHPLSPYGNRAGKRQ